MGLLDSVVGMLGAAQGGQQGAGGGNAALINAVVGMLANGSQQGGLERLTQSYLRVGVVSGRPVAFLARFLPRAVHLSGLHGMEEVDGHGGAVVADRFLRFAGPVRAAVVDAIGAEATDPGLEGLDTDVLRA